MIAPSEPSAVDLPDVRRLDAMPIAALVFGILGVVGSFFAPLAVMAGVIWLWPAYDRPGVRRSEGLAVAGLVLGCVGTVVALAVNGLGGLA